MWYSGTAISQIFTIPEIGYAWSLDGVNWNRSANPVLPKRPGKWDDGGTAQATVLQDGDTLRMWYTGAGADPTEFQDIGFAISTDGIHWTKYQGNPILESPDTWTDDIFSPNVILDGDQYRMWFSGSEPVFPFDAKIGYATAPVAIPAPVIVSIHDVPNDQGRQVRVTWNSSRFDGIDPTHKIIEYNVWRKVDGGASQSASLLKARNASCWLDNPGAQPDCRLERWLIGSKGDANCLTSPFHCRFNDKNSASLLKSKRRLFSYILKE
jgi:predicted GH43/DUF377 family glycosyl hydrolase